MGVGEKIAPCTEGIRTNPVCRVVVVLDFIDFIDIRRYKGMVARWVGERAREPLPCAKEAKVGRSVCRSRWPASRQE